MSAGWTVGAGRPTVVQPSAYTASGEEGGIDCGCCRCCPWIYLGFLRSKAGWLKIIELVLTAITLILVLDYGLPYSETIGQAFDFFLIIVSAGIFVISLLVFCYIISPNSFNLIRASVLELVFNLLICALYFACSCHLSWAVQTYLYPHYRVTAYYTVYPAMTAAYVLGFVLTVTHGLDAILALRHLKGRP
ncbi:protein singles bar-like [Macrobrachium nipponense]|uniref:protein singles bar-like n=1 Tax=Macrobrachium nipponense TaxID=159736 RepID=UPI0030C7C218